MEHSINNEIIETVFINYNINKYNVFSNDDFKFIFEPLIKKELNKYNYSIQKKNNIIEDLSKSFNNHNWSFNPYTLKLEINNNLLKSYLKKYNNKFFYIILDDVMYNKLFTK